MKKSVYWWTILSIILLVACGGGSSGGGDSGPSDVDPPFIESTTPVQGQYSVHPANSISFACNEPLNLSTVSEANVNVQCDNKAIDGAVDYSNQTITFTPSKRMPFYANCTATVSGIKDEAGNSMFDDYLLSFRTMSLDEFRPDLLLSLSPAEDTSDVYPYTDIKVWLEEDVNALTVNPANFSVLTNGVYIPGELDVAGKLITFTPDSLLEYGTTYTVTLGTSLGGLSGATLESDYSWSFTTMQVIGVEETLGIQSEKIRAPKLHVDGAGKILMVWGQGRHSLADYPTSLWWSAFTADTGWSTPSVLVDPGSGQILEIQLAGNTKGERFLYWVQSGVGRFACRYDPQMGGWESPVELTDIPSGCGGQSPCSSSVQGLAVGSDGSAVLAFMEIYYPPLSAKARAKRYDPGIGWQPSEDLELNPWTWGQQLATYFDCAIDNQGNALVAWTAGSGYPDPVGVRFNRYVKGVGWSGAVELDTDISTKLYDIKVDGSGNAFVQWSRSQEVQIRRYQPSVGWSSTQNLGSGDDTHILFNAAGSAMVLITPPNGNTRVDTFSPTSGWGTTYQLISSGSVYEWIGDPGTRAVAVLWNNGHLWRTIYTPTQLWGESEAIGPADRNYGQSTLLPDGTGVIGWTMGENTNWTIGVTWFQ